MAISNEDLSKHIPFPVAAQSGNNILQILHEEHYTCNVSTLIAYKFYDSQLVNRIGFSTVCTSERRHSFLMETDSKSNFFLRSEKKSDYGFHSGVKVFLTEQYSVMQPRFHENLSKH